MSKAKAQRAARPTLCGFLTPRSPAQAFALVASQQENEGADDRHAIADPNPEEAQAAARFLFNTHNLTD